MACPFSYNIKIYRKYTSYIRLLVHTDPHEWTTRTYRSVYSRNSLLSLTSARQILGVFILFFHPPILPTSPSYAATARLSPNKDRLLRHSCNFPVVSELVNCGWNITSWWLCGVVGFVYIYIYIGICMRKGASKRGVRGWGYPMFVCPTP